MKNSLNLLNISLLFLTAFAFSTENISAQGSAPPNYPLKFTFIDPSGHSHDTLMNAVKFRAWKGSSSYPTYVKWKNEPFAVLRSGINGLGLFTDSSSTFTSGQAIGWSYYKTGSTGHFDLDYIQSNIGLFINNSATPNMQATLTSQGISLTALQTIPPGTELTVSYQSILNMFPNDPTAMRAIKYW